jgi:hypothetical protein
MKGMLAILAVATVALGPVAMFNLYFMPYWVGVVWLDIVTYLHHHGTEDPEEQIPWYRGEVHNQPSLIPPLILLLPLPFYRFSGWCESDPSVRWTGTKLLAMIFGAELTTQHMNPVWAATQSWLQHAPLQGAL